MRKFKVGQIVKADKSKCKEEGWYFPIHPHEIERIEKKGLSSEYVAYLKGWDGGEGSPKHCNWLPVNCLISIFKASSRTTNNKEIKARKWEFKRYTGRWIVNGKTFVLACKDQTHIVRELNRLENQVASLKNRSVK